MMNKKIKVSVGIPAYNEEKNIKAVITEVLSQEENNWELQEVIVNCDGCSDGTALKAKEIKSEYVKVIEDDLRKGKTQRLKELFEMFMGDVLIMFDADIKLSDKNVITHLVNEFLNESVMLVGGNSRPFLPKTFVEKAVYSTFIVFYESRKKIKSGNNIFGATGSILAIRKDLAKKMNLPKIVCEDAFIYLDCIKRDYKFKYVDNAIVWYKLPSSFKDYVKQVFRSNPESVEAELEKYFGELVRKEFKRPFRFYASSIIREFFRNPLGVVTIMIINLFCRPFHKLIMKNYNLGWFTAESTH